MNFGEMKAEVRAILNRTDVTDTVIGGWVNQAITRSSMKLRLPPQETTLTAPITTANGIVPVPTNYLEMIDISINDEAPLDRVNLAMLRAHELDGNIGYSRVYTRRADNFHLAPWPAVGDTVTLFYYADNIGRFADDTDRTILTDNSPYLYIFGALYLAGVRYADDRRAEWQENYDRLIVELESSAKDEAMSGGNLAIQPAYYIPED